MGMESEVVTLRKTRDDALTKADKNDAALTGALGGLAQRMEALAEKLAVKGKLEPRSRPSGQSLRRPIAVDFVQSCRTTRSLDPRAI